MTHKHTEDTKCCGECSHQNWDNRNIYWCEKCSKEISLSNVDFNIPHWCPMTKNLTETKECEICGKDVANIGGLSQDFCYSCTVKQEALACLRGSVEHAIEVDLDPGTIKDIVNDILKDQPTKKKVHK